MVSEMMGCVFDDQRRTLDGRPVPLVENVVGNGSALAPGARAHAQVIVETVISAIDKSETLVRNQKASSFPTSVLPSIRPQQMTMKDHVREGRYAGLRCDDCGDTGEIF